MLSSLAGDKTTKLGKKKKIRGEGGTKTVGYTPAKVSRPPALNIST